MRISYPVFEFNEKAIALAGTAIIMVILLGANVTTTNAQQQQQQEQEQQQPLASQPATSSAAQNRTIARTLFESTTDNFRVRVPQGWVIHDVNNTGFTLAAEVLQGYGVLAQLCPGVEEGRQQGEPTNVSSSSSCQQQAQQDIIHIIRYPNLDNRLEITLNDINNIIPDSILEYQIQKLHEVGYRDINIVNARNVRIGINFSITEDVPLQEATVPARLVEITYSTDSAPGEMRRGYLILTATNVTPPDVETITGYSIFYEGAAAAEQTTTAPSGNLTRASLPVPLRQVFGSFELIATEEAAQIILDLIAQQAEDNEPDDQVEENGAGEE
jgi:hypothetical protein